MTNSIESLSVSISLSFLHCQTGHLKKTGFKNEGLEGWLSFSYWVESWGFQIGFVGMRRVGWCSHKLPILKICTSKKKIRSFNQGSGCMKLFIGCPTEKYPKENYIYTYIEIDYQVTSHSAASLPKKAIGIWETLLSINISKQYPFPPQKKTLYHLSTFGSGEGINIDLFSFTF